MALGTVHVLCLSCPLLSCRFIKVQFPLALGPICALSIAVSPGTLVPNQAAFVISCGNQHLC